MALTLKIKSILEFFNPEYLNTSISLLLKSLIKKICVAINNINGKISKSIDGEFNKDKNNKKFVSIFISLKKSNSVNIFRIKTKLRVINETKNKDFINDLLRNLV
tara:strand:+ start:72 stop:386 length:315 start_codon:yes stop_codon:yes gene_type:complete